MTCAHVLGLIDAGPFADYPRARLDAAWEHARGCATCGPALAAAQALTMALVSLPQPGPPRDLAGGVLARIAQIEARSAAAAAEGPHARAAAGAGHQTAAAATAVAATLVMAATIGSGHGTPLDLVSPKVGGFTAPLAAWPATATGAVVLAAGLALYLVGLFAPLGGGTRRT